MADETEDSQKTEDASQRKLDEARDKGQVALSREVLNWSMMLAITAIVLLWAPLAATRIEGVLLPFVEQPHAIRLDGSFAQAATTMLAEIGFIVVPALLLTVGAAIGGTFIQTGSLFATQRLQPKLDHISPLRGLERIFSMRPFTEFLKGVGKIVLVGAVAFWLVLPEIGRLNLLVSVETADVVKELQGVTLRVVIGVAATLSVVALLDYLHQRFAFLRSMKMSKQEVREEYKQVEGDPHIKGKLKQIRAERARRRMMAAVPDAAVVITNPTHFAVALHYEMEKSRAPKLVAKGADLVAQRIREVAKENGVLIIENPPLARTLYAAVELDQEIPEEHYKAVAEVISYALRLQGKLKPRSAQK